jgi:uncharacterized phage-associated protein
MAESITVANKILEYAKAKDRAVTPLQLIKLVYLCHGWSLAFFKRPLINENIEAWQYGPVVPMLYQRVKAFRNQPVVGPLKSMNPFASPTPLSNDEEALIEAVYDKYGGFSGVDLSNLTHRPSSPWDITWSQSGKNSIISNDLIQQHYDEIRRERSQSSVAAG